MRAFKVNDYLYVVQDSYVAMFKAEIARGNTSALFLARYACFASIVGTTLISKLRYPLETVVAKGLEALLKEEMTYETPEVQRLLVPTLQGLDCPDIDNSGNSSNN
jgi:hypothetical protein